MTNGFKDSEARRDAGAGAGNLASAAKPSQPGNGAETDPLGHAGHRERLKARFRQGGADNLPDYELMELLLFRSVPRRDTKPLAKALIKRFGSFAEALSASEQRLREVDGVGEAIITDLALVRSAAQRLARGHVMERPILASWQAVLDYCRLAMAFETREQFRILFLDKRNRVVADEVQQEGTVDHTPVYVREVVKRALEVSATAIILAHNHPSGDPTPSRADIELTRQIVDIAKPLGIVVHDHLIIGRDGHSSFRGLGLI